MRFPGAIDNASGVAVLLEIVRQLKDREEKLPFNILVAFLTGEESGMHGAKHLVSNPPVPLAAAINLDCLGFENELNALRTGHTNYGEWLADLASDVIKSHGVEVKWIAGGDDSVAFLNAGIPSIGLGQKPTLPTAIRIHTTEDAVEKIHHRPLEKGMSIVSDIIRRLEQYYK
ncbi:M28 family metallopeptidase [Brevibacillus sp. SYSU BS000544]|uniref:M28 family metallopeptidase n=1 Tax=Brevibacillus sp. SYSU BS000544 TaxID=3416443 RepID=UPI003CE46C12